ncbi:MAG: hypothetical protein FWG03_00760 [Clostridiales bacterium]|nr:hypothetical protein [Clostridiales bacterium]
MKTIVCYGDSNTWGFIPATEEEPLSDGLVPEESARFPYGVRWPGALSRLLENGPGGGSKSGLENGPGGNPNSGPGNAPGGGYLVVEEGLNGRTTAFNDMLGKYRNGAKYIGVCLATNKPIDLLIIMLGSNDTKNYLRQTAAGITRGVERLVTIAFASGCGPGGGPPEILIISPARLQDAIMSSRMRLEFDQASIQKSQELAGLYFNLARRYGCYYMNASVYADASQTDGLHLDKKNHKKLAKAVCTKVLEIFGQP